MIAQKGANTRDEATRRSRTIAHSVTSQDPTSETKQQPDIAMLAELELTMIDCPPLNH